MFVTHDGKNNLRLLIGDVVAVLNFHFNAAVCESVADTEEFPIDKCAFLALLSSTFLRSYEQPRDEDWTKLCCDLLLKTGNFLNLVKHKLLFFLYR